jgi:hypothetical protein
MTAEAHDKKQQDPAVQENSLPKFIKGQPLKKNTPNCLQKNPIA